ncbi:MAG: flagellar basal body P-ring formation chaperone FlgA [Mariprofundaceae bacterium]|nr:flagellar basal body P-ring formation chaperone FlgA [Mariprofundaceae bacterium]
MRLTGLLFFALLTGVSSAAWAEDTPMKASLDAFFAQGVRVSGATAKLIGVQRWPNAKGRLIWHLPRLRKHPVQISLIATQGTGLHARRWYVPVRVHWWADAVVVKNDTPTRAMLTPSMLDRKLVDVAGHAGRWWNDTRQLVGTRTTRPLQKGQAIFNSYVKRPPLIKRGDEVSMIAHIGGIRVFATGKALRSAGLGDTVRVQNIRSKQIMQATVSGAHTVRVISRGA